MNTITFDGYSFGDRLLEGVMFEADIEDNQIRDVRIAPSHDDSYWEDLNQKKWLKEAEQYVKDMLAENGSIANAISNGDFESVV
jgi:hypothetical protein